MGLVRRKPCVRAMCPGNQIEWHTDNHGQNGFWSCIQCGHVLTNEPAPVGLLGDEGFILGEDDDEACTCVGSDRFCKARRHWWEKETR